MVNKTTTSFFIGIVLIVISAGMLVPSLLFGLSLFNDGETSPLIDIVFTEEAKIRQIIFTIIGIPFLVIGLLLVKKNKK